jgi:hypothetical protein
MKMFNELEQKEKEMGEKYNVTVGQEYDIITANGKRFTISIESEDENYFFVSMGSAGLGVPKSEMNSLLDQNQAVLVKDWD